MSYWENYFTIKAMAPAIPWVVNFALYYLFSFLPRKGLFWIIHLGFWPTRIALRLLRWALRLILIRLLYRSLKSGIRRLYRRLVPRKCPEINLSLEEIDKMGTTSGKWFEEYIAEVYRTMGHKAHTTTEMRQLGTLPKSIMKQRGCGDQGVDVVVDSNERTGNRRIIVQCKHYSQNVGNSAVQEIVGAMKMYKGDKAVVITNQYFTESAINLAKENDVTLIDRSNLPQLIKNAVKCKTKVAA
jgi:restriction system protein